MNAQTVDIKTKDGVAADPNQPRIIRITAAIASTTPIISDRLSGSLKEGQADHRDQEHHRHRIEVAAGRQRTAVTFDGRLAAPSHPRLTALGHQQAIQCDAAFQAAAAVSECFVNATPRFAIGVGYRPRLLGWPASRACMMCIGPRQNPCELERRLV